MAEDIPPAAAREGSGSGTTGPDDAEGSPSAVPYRPGGDTSGRLRTFCRGVLHAIGMFDPRDIEEPDPAEYRTWFCLGETFMAGLFALNIAVPAFFWFAGMTALPLAFIAAAVLFLPLFVFLPKIIRSAVNTDTDAVIGQFGKNEQVKKVFWALFAALAGMVLAEVVDPAMAEKIAGAIAGVVP